MGHLNNKTAIITGAGYSKLSDGRCGSIGYGIATAYAKEGANLVITGRNTKKLEDAKEELERLYGIEVLTLPADIAAGEDNEATAQAVVRTYEGLKVPREALRVDENGQNGVYCLIDSQVKFKPIEIIFEKDSYYVAKYDSSDIKSLLLYDEIVVSAKNLENKKIVK
jgi:NAD(P)-dependent dehydrogenase (short-subunit alcohol dehydrogenase family)